MLIAVNGDRVIYGGCMDNTDVVDIFITFDMEETCTCQIRCCR